MNTQTLVNNVSSAILWSAQAFYDQNFHGYTLTQTATLGLDSVMSKYENYFKNIQILDTENLPNEKEILGLFNQNMALVSEEFFITGEEGVVKTENQIFSAKTLIQALKGKTVYLITK